MKRINLVRGRASMRLLRACCRFGIGLTHGGAARETRHVDQLDRLASVAPGQIALVTGPSGSGKSTLLRALGARLHVRTARAGHPSYSHRRRVPGGRRSTRRAASACAIIDLIPLPLDRALRTLACVGLADPLLLGRTPEELSTGERARFDLARAISRRAGWVLLDEFLTTLDRETATSVARSLRRAVTNEFSGLRVVVATAHGDLGESLEPDVHVELESAIDCSAAHRVE